MSEKSTKLKKQYNFENNLVISEKNKCVKSKYFYLVQCPDIKFYTIATRTGKQRLNIKVSKSYSKSAIAAIELAIDDLEPVKKYVSDWKHDVIFDNFVIPFNCDACFKNSSSYDSFCKESISHIYIIPIRCSITWFGFTDDLLSARIIKNMETFLETSEFSDVKIRVKNNVEFPAHKVILAAHSPVFRKMLTTDMKESRENCIYLPELDADTANELLYFLYHGKLDKACNDCDMLLKLVEVADMYCLTDLKSVCDVSLRMNLSCENALTVLELSRAFNLRDLRRQTLAFVASNVDLICENEDL